METSIENGKCVICGGVVEPGYHGHISKVCTKPECRHEFRVRVIRSQVIGEGERVCDRPGCNKFVPAGNYPVNKTKFFHDARCRNAYYKSLTKSNCTCLVCNKPLYRAGEEKKTPYCRPCFFEARTEEVISRRAGVFADIHKQYEAEYAKGHYRANGFYSARCYLMAFYEFLSSIGIVDLEQVTPGTITKFLQYCATRRQTTNGNLGAVSVFFNWLITEGKRQANNPVISRFHRQTVPKRLPRPYKDDEMAEIWSLLELRGNTQAKLAVAIGEEVGLRISETCRLKLGDVDLRGQQFFIALPNKNMTEAWVPFSSKTKAYLSQWLSERPECLHDHIFCNSLNGAMDKQCMTRLLNSIFLKDYKGEHRAEGLKVWSYHRLRHHLSTTLINNGADPAVVMAIGRWKTFEAMKQYTAIDPEFVRNSYNAAMEKAEHPEEKTTTQSMESFLKSRAKAPKPTTGKDENVAWKTNSAQFRV